MFDRNMDGYIDMSELRKMFAMVGVGDGGVFSRDEMEEFMEEADRVSVKCCVCVTKLIIVTGYTVIYYIYFFQDGNGKLDYNEFIKMLKQYD